MKVLQFGKYYPPVHGGIESVMYDLTEGLNDKGVECDVLCSSNTSEHSSELYNDKYRVTRTPSWGKVASTSISPKMVNAFKSMHHEYDIIHIHLPDPMANLALCLASPKAKIVVHWHSDIVKQKFLQYLYMPLLVKLLERADVIIATSRSYVLSSTWLNKYIAKVKVIPIGIFDPTSNAVGLEKNILYQDKKVIFSIGRMSYYKGFEYLIRSAHHLPDDYLIVIAGAGDLYDVYKKLIQDHNLQDKVKLVGRVDQNELYSYFKYADIFCLPSIARSEAFGVVLLEAMAFSKPIIATKICGSATSWVNEHGVSGLNVDVCNEKEIADAAMEIITNQELYANLSIGARARFENNFTREHMIKDVVSLYDALLKS